MPSKRARRRGPGGPRGARCARLTLALLIALTTIVTTADDWPTYLHDAQRSAASANESTISPANAPALSKLWSRPTNGQIVASATVAGGTVYVGSWDGYEYALNASSGTVIWKTYLGSTSSSAAGCFTGAHGGVSSSATVQNGVVYVGGGGSYWYALNAANGAVLWKVYTGDNSAGGGHYNWSSPLIYNGYAYIGIASYCDSPIVQGQLLQVSLSTHQVVNTFDVVPAGQRGGAIWTSPSVDPSTNTIYVATGNTGQQPASSQPWSQALVALDATTLAVKGAWQVPISQETGDSDWSTTPTIFDDAAGHTLVAAVNKSGYLYAFDRTNISAGPLWQCKIAIAGSDPISGDASVSSPAVGNGMLYIAGGNTTINNTFYAGSVRALDPSTGAVLWQSGTSAPVIGALAFANGLLVDGTGTTLQVRNAATGAVLYSFAARGSILSAPSIANGHIYAGSAYGLEYSFGLSHP